MGNFQRRHYKEVAEVIQSLQLPQPLKWDVAYAFANRFAQTNERFDATRFLIACGVIDAENS